MLWVKAFHIVFVVSWFAGMFYLPRIFVNLALEQEREPHGGVAAERLLLMARKLYRFTMWLSVPAVLLGGWLVWLQYGGGDSFKLPGWLHAKLTLALLAVGYTHGCGKLLKKFELAQNTRSHVWYRWFNEVPVLLLVGIVVLVVVKPF